MSRVSPAEQRRQEQELLSRVRASPAEFRRYLLVDTDDGPQPLGKILDPWQRQDFESLDPAWRAVCGFENNSPSRRRAYLERPRGHSKTSDIAAAVSWALFSSPKKLAGIIAAADQDQARLIRDAVDRLCRLNPWLAASLEVLRDKVVNRATGSEAVVISSDAGSSYGLTPHFIVADEVSHWPNADLWNSLFSAAAKRRDCLLVVISNAGFVDSWLWPVYQQIRADAAAWYFHRLEGPQASWITADRLDEQEKLLPALAYQRLWKNQWSMGSGDALEDASINDAATLASPLDAPEIGWQYVAGVDLGLIKDATAIAVVSRHVGYMERIAAPASAFPAGHIATLADLGLIDRTPQRPAVTVKQHPGSGRYKLAALTIFRPAKGNPVRIVDVESEILRLHEIFRLKCVACDQWQARHLVERLQLGGIAAEPIDFNGSNQKVMAETLLSAFGERQLSIFPDSALLADLRSLRVVEKNYGIRLESPRKSGGEGTRHGDAATGLMLGLHAARRWCNQPAIDLDNRPLVLWP